MNLRSQFKPMFYDEQGLFQENVAANVIQEAQKQGLFKAFLPEELLGNNWDLSQTLTLFRDTAYCSGSFGWLIQIGNGGTYFVCNNNDSTNQHFFSSIDAVLTGSAMVGGSAHKTVGGYLVSGQWKYASGSAFATVFTATVMREDTQEVWTALIPREQVTVIEDWNTLGMRSTSSNSFKVEQVFVAEEHFFQTAKKINYLDHAIFNLPFFVYAQVFFTSTLQGMIERFVEEGKGVLEHKRDVWEKYVPGKVERVSVLEEMAVSWLQSTQNKIDELVDCLGTESILNEAEIMALFKENAQTIKEWAHQWFSIFGMEVLDQTHIVNIFYRDILTITHHGLLQI